mmetsp:Transcript_112543/g.314467  ORF Transcript_112543/g.314467 Transcript_112543/m.314467 type:complete len:228 (-) Transcript_112543:439-1122(-)
MHRLVHHLMSPMLPPPPGSNHRLRPQPPLLHFHRPPPMIPSLHHLLHYVDPNTEGCLLSRASDLLHALPLPLVPISYCLFEWPLFWLGTFPFHRYQHHRHSLRLALYQSTVSNHRLVPCHTFLLDLYPPHLVPTILEIGQTFDRLVPVYTCPNANFHLWVADVEFVQFPGASFLVSRPILPEIHSISFVPPNPNEDNGLKRHPRFAPIYIHSVSFASSISIYSFHTL